jgi:hypothetical protein
MTTEQTPKTNSVYFVYCVMNKDYDTELESHIKSNIKNILFITKHELSNKIIFGVEKKSRFNLEYNNEKLVIKPYKFFKAFVKINIDDKETIKDFIIKTYNSCYVGFNDKMDMVYFNIKDPKLFHNVVENKEKFNFNNVSYDICAIYRKNRKPKFYLSFYISVKINMNMFTNEEFYNLLQKMNIEKVKKNGFSQFTNKKTNQIEYIYWFITSDKAAFNKFKKYNEENSLGLNNLRCRRNLNTNQHKKQNINKKFIDNEQN